MTTERRPYTYKARLFNASGMDLGLVANSDNERQFRTQLARFALEAAFFDGDTLKFEVRS